MADLTNSTTTSAAGGIMIDCQVEATGTLSITVGEKKNLVCKIPETSGQNLLAPGAAGRAGGEAGGLPGSPSAIPNAAATTSPAISPSGVGSSSGTTSGAGADMASNTDTASAAGSSANKSIQFVNGDAAHPYDVQFIGVPVVNGATVTQAFTSYKVGFKEITAAKLKIDGRDFAIAPFRFEVKTVIDPAAAGAPPSAGAQQGMPPAVAGRDEEGTNPNGQVQKQTEQKPFPVVGPEGVPAPWWWWAMWAVVVIAVIGYLVKVFLKYKKNKKHQDEVQATVLTPQQKFQQKMRKLESQGYHLQSKYKSFALDLTAIVKSTIGEVLKFAAEDMTTEELLETLQKRHKTFYQSSGALLKTMMAELDQIKFAKTETSSDRCIALLDDANKIGRALFGGAP